MSTERILIHGDTASRLAVTQALGQVGSDDTLGQVVLGDGTTPGGILMAREDKKNDGSLGYTAQVETDDYTIVAADVGKIIVANKATAIEFTLTVAATLGAKFVCIVRNEGVGELTVTPDGAEEIDGESSLVLAQGSSAILSCDGTGFRSIAFSGGGGSEIVFANKSGAYTALAADKAAVHRFTDAGTVNLTAAATLGAGWYYTVVADGGDRTIDPDASETIGGASTFVVANGTSALIWCDGTQFFVAGLKDGSIANAKLAAMAQATIKGRASGAGTGAPADLAASDVYAILSGLVPPKPVATASVVGEWVKIGGTGGVALVLPAGGTWAYFFFVFNTSGGSINNPGSGAGVAAGGTTVQAASGTLRYDGFAWRIA